MWQMVINFKLGWLIEHLENIKTFDHKSEVPQHRVNLKKYMNFREFICQVIELKTLFTVQYD